MNPMPDLSATAHALTFWKTDVRMMGAGAIGAAAIVTLAGLAKPVIGGLKSAMEASRRAKDLHAEIPRSEQDLPIFIVGLVVLISMVPTGWLLASFLQGGRIGEPERAAGSGRYCLCPDCRHVCCCRMRLHGRLDRLIELAGVGHRHSDDPRRRLSVGAIGRHLIGPEVSHALVAFALFVTTVVLAVAVIGNDNLQDLKTGQLVDATPWKQQVGLLIGVAAGSVVVPPVLELLNHANGFAGAPNLNAISSQPLDAPQATLISTLAKGRHRRRLALGSDHVWRPARTRAGFD